MRAPSPSAAALIGAAVTLVAMAGLTWSGYHHDAVGTGPSLVESALLWGSLLLGAALLLAALLRWGRRS